MTFHTFSIFVIFKQLVFNKVRFFFNKIFLYFFKNFFLYPLQCFIFVEAHSLCIVVCAVLTNGTIVRRGMLRSIRQMTTKASLNTVISISHKQRQLLITITILWRICATVCTTCGSETLFPLWNNNRGATVQKYIKF